MFKFKIDYNSFVQTNLNKLSFFFTERTHFPKDLKRDLIFTEQTIY